MINFAVRISEASSDRMQSRSEECSLAQRVQLSSEGAEYLLGCSVALRVQRSSDRFRCSSGECSKLSRGQRSSIGGLCSSLGCSVAQ